MIAPLYAVGLCAYSLLAQAADSSSQTPPPKVVAVSTTVSMAEEAQQAIEEAHAAARDAAKAAQAAAEAARSAAEAAKSTAGAVETLATHVEDIEHPEPKHMPELPEWSYQLSLSALANRGNADNFAGKLTTGVDGNWHQWSTELRGNAAYGLANVSNKNVPTDTTTFNGGISARGEHQYTPFIGNYALAAGAFDHVANIRYQAYGDLGVVIIWWEVERHGFVKSRLRTSLGARLMRESRAEYYTAEYRRLGDRWVWGPDLTVGYRYAINKDVYVAEDADLLYNVADGNDIRFGSTTTLGAKMTDRVSLQASVKLRYIGEPAEGKKPFDGELSTGLNFSF
jgi:putative salt-induced outer membrane protein YdiY